MCCAVAVHSLRGDNQYNRYQNIFTKIMPDNKKTVEEMNVKEGDL